MLAIVAPGQGAQSPGFLGPWLASPTFADRLEWLSAVAALDLAHYGTQADEAAIRDTQIAQPLLVGTALAAAHELFADLPEAGVDVVAGHSVGELAAAAWSGVLSTEQATVLVRERGRAMATAAAVRPTGMTAVLGGSRDAVLASLAEHGLTAANDNGPGQIVAAGTEEELAAFAESPPDRARVRSLAVAGAFHTEHMAPAVDRLASLARSVTVRDPRVRLLSNRDGEVVTSGDEALSRLVSQIAHPVRWDLCLTAMSALGVTGLLEVPPAGTLVGIAKRALKGVETFALKTPDQLDDARAFCAEHAGRPAETGASA